MKPGDLMFIVGNEYYNASGKKSIGLCELFRDGTSPGDPGDSTFVDDGVPVIVMKFFEAEEDSYPNRHRVEVFFEGESWLVYDIDLRETP